MPRRYERRRKIDKAPERESRREARPLHTRPKPKRRVSPGRLYKEIEFSSEEFEKGEKKLFKKKEPRFVRFCKRAYRTMPSLGKGAKFTEEFRNAVDFLGWDIKPEEFSAAVKFTMLLSLVLSFAFVMLVWFTPLSGMLSSLAGPMWIIYILMPVFLLVFFLPRLVQRYPVSVIKTEQRRALGYIPEMIGYMVMSLKLTPNLEKAVEFAAEHGRGKISADFRSLLWSVEIGVYPTLSEGLDELAYKWGKYSKEFKLALMRIRASVLEDTEAKRYALLDKTTEGLLSAVKEKMEQYARDLSMPSAILFYLGVLLPIILFIVLPIGAFVTGSPLANPVVLVLLYNVGIPLGVFFFAVQVVRQRPPTYEPPEIPENYPGLPKKGRMVLGRREMSVWIPIAIILIAGVSVSWFLHVEGIPPKSTGYGIEGRNEPLLPDEQLLPADRREADVLREGGYNEDYFALPPAGSTEGGDVYNEFFREYSSNATELSELRKYVGEDYAKALEQQNPGWSTARLKSELARIAAEKALYYRKTVFFMQKENDTTPNNLIFGLMLTTAVCIYFFVYYSNIYRRKVQVEIMQLESEFKDSLYIIASRLGENKPMEEALRHVKEFLPNYKISDRIFGRALDNIHLMGMPLESAVFDPRYGALVNIPSKTIKVGMKVLVDSVKLGVNVAARTLVSMSLQLENSEKVSKMLKNLVMDISQLMRTMIVFIAPVVLGITTSLFKVIVRLFASFAGDDLFESSEAAAGAGLGTFNVTTFEQLINPEALLSMVSAPMFLAIMLVYIVEIAVIVIYYTTKIEEDNNLLVKVNLAKYVPISMIVFTVSFFVTNIVVSSFGGGF